MTRPRSTAELSEQITVQVEHNVPIRLYFRSADLLLRQARVYKLENDLEHAFSLYMKYTILGISELPKHPSYNQPEYKKNIKSLKRNCLEALEALEEMKPAINEAYTAYMDKLEEARKAEREASILQQTSQWQKQQQQQSNQTLESPEPPKNWSLQDALKGVAGIGIDDDIKQDMSNHHHHHQQTQYPSYSLHNQSDGYAYHAQEYTPPSNLPPTLPPKVFNQPDLPPKVLNEQPALPPKIPIERKAPELPPKIKLEEHRTGVTTDASSERGEPLRKMLLPKGLQQRFLSIAQPNTSKKIETCGILAGELKNNVLKITTLIIPKQTGTSDTCTTENEEELFDIQDKYDLLTFGWIHTHPTQSCFLSSVDLHTHCSYQLMLPEAIAIVCAPAHKPNFGIFRLTDPPGLDVISNCKQTPAFHPHPDLPIYTGAQEGGHVALSDYDFKVLDLRQ